MLTEFLEIKSKLANYQTQSTFFGGCYNQRVNTPAPSCLHTSRELTILVFPLRASGVLVSLYVSNVAGSNIRAAIFHSSIKCWPLRNEFEQEFPS